MWIIAAPELSALVLAGPSFHTKALFSWLIIHLSVGREGMYPHILQLETSQTVQNIGNFSSDMELKNIQK